MTACDGSQSVTRIVGIVGTSAWADGVVGGVPEPTFIAIGDMAIDAAETYIYLTDGPLAGTGPGFGYAIRRIHIATLTVETLYWSQATANTVSYISVGKTTGRVYFNENGGLYYLTPGTWAKTQVLPDHYNAGGIFGMEANAAETVMYISKNGDTGGFGGISFFAAVSTATWAENYSIGLGGFFHSTIDVTLDEVNDKVYAGVRGFDPGIYQMTASTGAGATRLAINDGRFGSDGPYYHSLYEPGTLMVSEDWDPDFSISNRRVEKMVVGVWPAVTRCDTPHPNLEPSGWTPSGVVVIDNRIWIADRTAIYMAVGGGWKVGMISIG